MDDDDKGSRSNYAVNGKIMLCSVIILFVAMIVIFCFHTHARYFVQHRRRRRRPRRRRAENHYSLSASISNTTVSNSHGLDVSVIKYIPTFIYSAAHQPPLECAVCLSEFEDNETARVLPKCHHAFHVECIDMWFHSHSNCPLCRAPVEEDIPVTPPETSDETTVVSVSEPAGSQPRRDDTELNWSPSTSPGSRIKTLELVGILVEVPSRVSWGSGLPGRNGSKSPSKGILSLRRICSI